jgi:hypothetical protein
VKKFANSYHHLFLKFLFSIIHCAEGQTPPTEELAGYLSIQLPQPAPLPVVYQIYPQSFTNANPAQDGKAIYNPHTVSVERDTIVNRGSLLRSQEANLLDIIPPSERAAW